MGDLSTLLNLIFATKITNVLLLSAGGSSWNVLQLTRLTKDVATLLLTLLDAYQLTHRTLVYVE